MNRPKPFRPKVMVLALAISTLALSTSITAAEKDTFYPGGIVESISPDGIQQLTTPVLRTEQLIQRYIDNHEPGQPLRFAEPFQLRQSITQIGTWTTEANGDHVWRLRIHSPGAQSINLGLSNYRMPEGGSLVIASGDDSQRIRPFTAADNKDHGQLWTPMIDGDNVLIEARVPANQRAGLQLELGSINAAFIDPSNPASWARSGACNVDVVCAEGDDWRDQIRSVGAYSVGGVDYCSGALVNNVNGDGTGYFLTANHCISSAGNAPSVVIYWNYENSVCRAPGSGASGGAGDGSRDQFSSGTLLRATNSASDFTLLEVEDPIPAEFELFWSGIDATGDTPDSTVAIHHPGVEEKRISFENDPLTIANYLGAAGSGTSHWRIADWDVGTTEGGSSGSPIFTPLPDQRIIGQLHGGYAACSNDDPDWYGRVSVSWEGGGTAATQLKAWLDPDNTGALVIDGRGGSPFTVAVDPAAVGVCATEGSVDINIDVGVSEPGFSDAVTLAFSGEPTGSSASLSASSVTPPGSSVLSISNLSSATAGSYSVAITATSGDDEVVKTVPFELSSGNPDAATLSLPADGATGLGESVELSWSSAANTLTYRVEVSDDPTFATTIYDEDVEGTSTTVAGLTGSTDYYWRVTPSNLCGEGDPSDAFSFRTAAAPGQCDEGVTPNVVFEEDFTGGLGEFTTTGSIGTSTWAISTARPSPASGGNAVLAQDLTAVSDQYLISPAITLPTDGLPLSLQFQNDQTIEDQSSGTACYDGALLEISTDDGATWGQVPSAAMLTRPYTGPVATAFSSPIAGLDAWCGDPLAWENQIVDLNAYAGQTVRFRWRMATDSSAGRVPDGWYVDDIKVQSCGEPPTDGINLGITLAASPEPVSTGGELTYTVNVANTGPEDATAVEVELTLPTDVSFVEGRAAVSKARPQVRGTDWTCAEASGTVLCELAGPVAAAGGTAPVLTVTALVADDAAPGTVTTTATVTGAETENAPGNNTASVDTEIVGAPEPDDGIFCDGFEDGGDGSCTGGGSGGETGVYDDRVEFLDNVTGAVFEPDFNTNPTGSITAPLVFEGEGFTVTIDSDPAGGGLWGEPGGILTPNAAADGIKLTFSGDPVTAFGANVWGTDISVNPLVATVTITLDDGTVETFEASNADAFRGFVTEAPITSVTLKATSGAATWTTLANVVVGAR